MGGSEECCRGIAFQEKGEATSRQSPTWCQGLSLLGSGRCPGMGVECRIRWESSPHFRPAGVSSSQEKIMGKALSCSSFMDDQHKSSPWRKGVEVRDNSKTKTTKQPLDVQTEEVRQHPLQKEIVCVGSRVAVSAVVGSQLLVFLLIVPSMYCLHSLHFSLPF